MLICSMARASNRRSSKPSNRPQSRVTPGPAASCRTLAWVSGAPRGVRAITGRAVRDAIDRRCDDIGTQHHAGAAARRGVVNGAVLVGRPVTDIARSARPDAIGQRAAGKAVAQTAGEHVRVEGKDRGGPGHQASQSGSITTLHADFGHRWRAERHHHGLAIGVGDFENVAGVVVFDGRDRADRITARGDNGETDDVGVIIFAFAKRWQAGARDGQQSAAQALGGGAIADFGKARDGADLVGTQRFERQGATAGVKLLWHGQAVEALARTASAGLRR